MKILIFLISLLICIAHASDRSSEVIIAKAFDWVELINEEEFSTVSDQESVSGVHYHLFDRQIKKNPKEIFYFNHIIKKVINKNGVNNGACLEIEYNPLYESLVLHHVNIKRDKKILDHLNEAKIKILQREKELENNHYTGTKSVNIILNDVRVGDIISYSYTIKNKNPNNHQSFYTSFYTTNYVPIHYYRLRILWPQDSELAIKNHLTDFKPTINKSGKYAEYIWFQKNLPIVQKEPQTPIWYDPEPWIEIGEPFNWQEISYSFSKHYQYEQPLPPSLKEHIDQIAKKEKDLGKRFISAIRFVQDEIRYMAMSDRIDGFQPLDVELILLQRYGDCKDKTYLTLTLLKALGIEAYPALVHTKYGRTIQERLPHPAIFNHIIVVAFIKGKAYWVDPTESFQGGTLEDYTQPDYGYALILDGRSKSPTKMPSLLLTSPSIEIYETFDASQGAEKPGKLTIKTIFKNYHADRQREYHHMVPKKEIEEDYIKSYKKNYPSIYPKKDLTFSDDREKNIITMVEEYEIADLWEKGEKGTTYSMQTYAKEFNNYLIYDDIYADRKGPVEILFPRYILKETEIILPPINWDLEPESITITDPSFEFKKEEKQEKLKFIVSYSYKTFKDTVELERIATYLENLEQAYNVLGNKLWYNPSSAVNNSPSDEQKKR